jgi:predicted secreted protein
MAQPSTRAGYQVALYLGSDAASPVYAFVCGLDNVEINNERGVIERAIRDCSTPFAAPSMKRTPGLKMASISGSGLLATEYINDLNTAFAAGASRYWRVSVENGPAWTGKFVMSALNITGQADGQAYAEISISLQSDGDTTYTASP